MHRSEIDSLINDVQVGVLKILNRKWPILVVLAMSNYDGVRFNKLKTALPGINSKTLSETLRLLTEDGFVSSRRIIVPEARAEYTLTEKGQGLLNAIYPFLEWIIANYRSCE